jgi:hypothetical protein
VPPFGHCVRPLFTRTGNHTQLVSLHGNQFTAPFCASASSPTGFYQRHLPIRHRFSRIRRLSPVASNDWIAFIRQVALPPCVGCDTEVDYIKHNALQWAVGLLCWPYLRSQPARIHGSLWSSRAQEPKRIHEKNNSGLCAYINFMHERTKKNICSIPLQISRPSYSSERDFINIYRSKMIF